MLIGIILTYAAISMAVVLIPPAKNQAFSPIVNLGSNGLHGHIILTIYLICLPIVALISTIVIKIFFWKDILGSTVTFCSCIIGITFLFDAFYFGISSI